MVSPAQGCKRDQSGSRESNICQPIVLRDYILLTLKAYKQHDGTVQRSSTLLFIAALMFCSALGLTNGRAGTITWQFTDSMAIARAQHTATVLRDGQVLLVGGRGNGDPESAELYDPVSGQWSNAQDLGYEVDYHTATLLPDGTVLVAGGIKPSLTGPAYKTAKLYDPVTGTWKPTGDMNRGRYSHIATLLPNGEVLVAGGATDHGITIASAEIYDPATGQWRFTGSLNEARGLHQAVRLKNGKVLVTGGYDDDFSTLSSAEVYDLLAELWSETGSMGTARISFTLSRLSNGKALAVGGFLACPPICSSLKSTELYDPTSGTWAPGGDLTVGRSFHAATDLPKERVVVTGGFDEDLSTTASAEAYDPVYQRWVTIGPMRSERLRHTITRLHDGRILIAGGSVGLDEFIENTAELGTNTR